MLGKLPGFIFYPGDWLRDGVAGCSLEAQGLWLRMMIVAHDGERYGYLSQNGKPIPPEALARRCGATSLEQYLSLLAELDVAGVPRRSPTGIIFSKRMVDDDKGRALNRARVRKFRKTHDKCNGDVMGDVMPLYEDENENESKSLEVDVGSKDLKPSKRKQAHVLPEDFVPKQDHYDLAKGLGVNCEMEFQKMRDWALGKNERKADWEATFRNWLRNSINYRGSHAGLSKGERQYDDIKRARDGAQAALSKEVGH